VESRRVLGAGRRHTLVEGLSVGYELPTAAALEVFDADVATMAFRARLRDIEPVRAEAARLRTNPVSIARWLITTGRLRVMDHARRLPIGSPVDVSSISHGVLGGPVLKNAYDIEPSFERRYAQDLDGRTKDHLPD
jgi:hypothetical protein